GRRPGRAARGGRLHRRDCGSSEHSSGRALAFRARSSSLDPGSGPGDETPDVFRQSLARQGTRHENCGGSRPLTLDGRRGEPHSRRVKDLAEDFPTPTLDQWRALASKGLKGEPLDRLVSHTPDGLVIQPLYAAEPDAPALQTRPP